MPGSTVMPVIRVARVEVVMGETPVLLVQRVVACDW